MAGGFCRGNDYLPGGFANAPAAPVQRLKVNHNYSLGRPLADKADSCQASASTQRRIAVVVAGCLLFTGLAGVFFLLRHRRPSVRSTYRKTACWWVATRQSPAAFSPSADGPDGFEYALVENSPATWGRGAAAVPRTVETLLQATERGVVHMAAAGLAITPARELRALFHALNSSPSRSSTAAAAASAILRRHRRRRPLFVVAGSSHDEHLAELRARNAPV